MARLSPRLRGRCSCQLTQGTWGPGGFSQGEPRSPTPREVAQPLQQGLTCAAGHQPDGAEVVA